MVKADPLREGAHHCAFVNQLPSTINRTGIDRLTKYPVACYRLRRKEKGKGAE